MENSISINNQQQDILELKDNCISASTNSIDTEPEAETINLPHHDEGQIMNESTETREIAENNKQKIKNKKIKNGFEMMIQKIPSYEYDIPKKSKNHRIQKKKYGKKEFYDMNLRETDNNRFVSNDEAFLYIAKHCQNYHNKFTREICWQYLKNCYIIDFAHDEFIPILTHLSKKEFNKYFHMVQKELKYL